MKQTVFIFIIVLAASSLLSAQEHNIIPFLKQIEKGNAEMVKKETKILREKKEEDPSVMFLDAVLTAEGEASLEKYKTVYEKWPSSAYADASLFRVFSYNYSLGYYKQAGEYLEKLKKEYPSSPYIKAADRDIPDSDEITVPSSTPPPAVQKKKPEPAAPVVKAEPEYRFTVKAGAFHNRDNALKLKADLEEHGYATELSVKQVGGSTFNIVTAGKFVTEQEAAPLIGYLKSKYKINGRVISAE